MADRILGSSRDISGRKREYETTYILRPDITNDGISTVNNKVRGVIEAGGGNLLKVENWGRRKLAYEVKKNLKGVYLFFNYLGPAGLVEEVERNLRLSDSVIRYYSVKIAENVDADHRRPPPSPTSRSPAPRCPVPTRRPSPPVRPGVRTFGEEEEEGGFDFEEAVFGSADEPRRKD